MFDKLRKASTNRCCFVSSTGANVLRELTERAQRRSTLEEFEKELQENDTLRSSFEKYLLRIVPDRETAFIWLKRTRVILIDENSLIRQVERHIDGLVYRPSGDDFSARQVRLELADYILGHLGSPIRSEQVWEFLIQKGFAHRDWVRDLTIQEKLQAANDSYIRNVEL